MAERDGTPDKFIGSIPFGSLRQKRRMYAQDSIPYGSLRPNGSTITPGDESLTVPYGSLKPTPVPQTTPSQPVNQTPPVPPPKSVSDK